MLKAERGPRRVGDGSRPARLSAEPTKQTWERQWVRSSILGVSGHGDHGGFCELSEWQPETVAPRRTGVPVAGLLATPLASGLVVGAPAHAVSGGSSAAVGSYAFVAKLDIDAGVPGVHRRVDRSTMDCHGELLLRRGWSAGGRRAPAPRHHGDRRTDRSLRYGRTCDPGGRASSGRGQGQVNGDDRSGRGHRLVHIGHGADVDAMLKDPNLAEQGSSQD
jgi:hypothetical protein